MFRTSIVTVSGKSEFERSSRVLSRSASDHSVSCEQVYIYIHIFRTVPCLRHLDEGNMMNFISYKAKHDTVSQ